MNKLWAEVSCEVPAAMSDPLSEFLVHLSGCGVTVENRSVDTFSLDTLDDTPFKTVTAYFPAGENLDGPLAEIASFLAEAGAGIAGFAFRQPSVSFIQEEDWANNWKEHFKPCRIGSKLVIKPTWESFPAEEGDIVIDLDPGMAFGTGTHPTTRLCLEAMERIFLGVPQFAAGRDGGATAVLDVGTGSGLLSIAAAKLGAATVVGIDIDPDAVAVAEENLALNHCIGPVRVSTEPLAEISGGYDIVLANILAEELVRLASQLVARLSAGGFLVLSGILIEKEELVRQGFAPFRLSPVETRRDAEWSCLVYRREG